MATPRSSDSEEKRTKRAPARTPQARERQLVVQAIDLAEKQIQNETASAQVITHYLKLGSSREHLEQERLKHEVHLLKIKAETLAAAARIEDTYVKALEAMKTYSPVDHNAEPEFDD